MGITDAPFGDEILPEGFCHISGIDLEIRDADGNGVVAEEELKLSIPVPEVWESSECGCEFPTDESECCELSPDCEYPLLVLREIRVFEGTPNEKAAYALNNIARIKDGRIETASPPFPGARASGPHLFVKPMYPGEFAMVTPSPMFGGSVLGMGCGNFGEIFSASLYNITAPIFMIPKGREFTVTVYAPTGDIRPGGQQLIGPREPADGFADLPIPAPADEGPMTILEAFPADSAGDVPIRVKVSVLFSRQVYEKSVTAETFSLRDGANRPVVGKTEIIYSDENSEVAAGIRFTPDRRLSFGTEYRILIAGVRGFDENQAVTETLAFTTFGPGVTGSASVESPYNISVLNNDRIAVANGSFKDDSRNSHGVVLLDVSDPENPVRLAEHALGGDTFGVYAVGEAGVPGSEEPAVLAVSGGMNSVSSLQVLKVTGENQDGLEKIGSALLSMDQTSLDSGTCIARVPCSPGIPRAVTLYGGDNAYVATTGIGVQGLSISDAVERTETDWPSNVSEPGLSAETASPMAVETMGDTILAGDIRKLRMLTPDLNPDAAVSLNVPARAMHGIPDYPADPDGDGEIAGDERSGFVFVAGQDRTFYIVETGDAPEVVSEIRFDTYLRDVRVSPYDRLAYVSTYNGKVYVVDIDDPYEGTELIDEDGDGRDDRILGTVSGLSGAGALDIGENYGYVGDTSDGKVHTFPLGRYSGDVDMMLCTEYPDGADLSGRKRGGRRDIIRGNSVCLPEPPETMFAHKTYSVHFKFPESIGTDSVITYANFEISDPATAGLSKDREKFGGAVTINSNVTVGDFMEKDYVWLRGDRDGKVTVRAILHVGDRNYRSELGLSFMNLVVDVRETNFHPNRVGKDDPRLTGDDKTSENKLLVWCDADDMMKFDVVRVNNPAHPSFWLRIEKIQPDVTEPTVVIREEEVATEYKSYEAGAYFSDLNLYDNLIIPDIIVKYGLDLDNDGHLLAKDEIAGEYEIYGVTREEYEASIRRYDRGYQYSVYELADSLLYRFFYGLDRLKQAAQTDDSYFVPVTGTPVTNSLTTSKNSALLTHNFGVSRGDFSNLSAWTSAGGREYFNADVKLDVYEYNASSVLLKHRHLCKFVTDFAMGIKYEDIKKAFNSVTTSGDVRNVPFSLTGRKIGFNAYGFVGIGGAELISGTIEFRVRKVTEGEADSYIADLPVIKNAVIEDLWDYNYFKGTDEFFSPADISLASRSAASIQCGFGRSDNTTPERGKIALQKIMVDGEVDLRNSRIIEGVHVKNDGTIPIYWWIPRIK